jgi:hypothetical protein
MLVVLVISSPIAVALPGPSGGGEDRSTKLSPIVGGLLVVAPSAWEDELQPYLDWRERTQGEVTFMSFEDALAEGDGRDAAAKLKSMIPHPMIGVGGARNLMIVGDADVIPVRKVFVNITRDGNESDPLNYRWTDDYFVVGSENTWDMDGDGIYGEDNEVLERVPLVYEPEFDWTWNVGRIPASNELELERFVSKLLAYERDPPPGDWFTSALVVSGLMDVPNHLDNPYTPDLDGGYELFSDNSWESHTKLMALLPEDYDVTWLWDYPFIEGGHWNQTVDTLNHTSITQAFDQGHSILAMNGHGWIDGSGLAHYNGSGYSNYWWDWSNAFDYNDADNVKNGGMLPFAYVAACYVGDVTISGDRSLERLVMNPDGGAIGLVAGNGENYKGESMANASYGNWFLERTFWRNYFEVGPGPALHNSKAAYLKLVSGDGVPHTPVYDAYYIADYLSHNLLGDPTSQVWTDVPTEVDVLVEDMYTVANKDLMRVTVTDGAGLPVQGARVWVAWEEGLYGDEGSRIGYTLRDGALVLPVPRNDPRDWIEIELVVSGPNIMPVELRMDRPFEDRDLVATGITWSADGISDGEAPPEGLQVSLKATVKALGRYDYDQVRVRFSTAPDGGDFERLVPDVFVPIEMGEEAVAATPWMPPGAGHWQVKVEVDPDGDKYDSVATNNVMVVPFKVKGPPDWTGPLEFQLDSSDAPGDFVPLLDHIEDPDTPLNELELTADLLEGPKFGTMHYLDAEGRLWVCTTYPEAELTFVVTVTDGTYEDITTITATITRETARLRLVTDPVVDVEEGLTARGVIEVENLGPGEAMDVEIVEVVDHPDFLLGEDGNYTFLANSPGTHIVTLRIELPDGYSDPAWEGITMVFHVSPDAGLPPQPYGWLDLRLVEGERAKVQLQAVDLEGGQVTFSIVDDGGLEASIDPASGMLKVHPDEGDTGKHEVVIRLSDGTNAEDTILNVYVAEAPSTSGLWVILVMLLVGAAMSGYIWWHRKHEREARERLDRMDEPKA